MGLGLISTNVYILVGSGAEWYLDTEISFGKLVTLSLILLNAQPRKLLVFISKLLKVSRTHFIKMKETDLYVIKYFNDFG